MAARISQSDDDGEEEVEVGLTSETSSKWEEEEDEEEEEFCIFIGQECMPTFPKESRVAVDQDGSAEILKHVCRCLESALLSPHVMFCSNMYLEKKREKLRANAVIPATPEARRKNKTTG